MPMPQLMTNWNNCQRESKKLEDLVDAVNNLPPQYRKLVAEITMLRLAILVENSVSSICAKLVCGSPYMDGNYPKRLATPRSVSGAQSLMRNHGRTRARQNLRWLEGRDIRENIRHVLDQSDPVFIAIRNHSPMMTEIRYIRNHIAHRNSSSRENFRKVVRAHFGGVKRGISPGRLLLTRSLGSPFLLKKYLIWYRVLVRELVRV